MRHTTTYDHTENGYRVRVIKATDGYRNTYTVKVTNVETGRSTELDGWTGRADAIGYAEYLVEIKAV